jgi:hypothetical protein
MTGTHFCGATPVAYASTALCFVNRHNALNRLIAHDSASYTYNGDGVLVSDGTTTYAQDLAAPLSQVLSDGTDTYVYGHERLRALGQRFIWEEPYDPCYVPDLTRPEWAIPPMTLPPV